jgi:hypothetical protein
MQAEGEADRVKLVSRRQTLQTTLTLNLSSVKHVILGLRFVNVHLLVVFIMARTWLGIKSA